MGAICQICNLQENEINSNTDRDRTEMIDENRKRIYFTIKSNDDSKSNSHEIELLVIHVDTIPNIMSFSKGIIDNGNKLPFIFNTDIETENEGKGNTKGNVYTASCIPKDMFPKGLNDRDILIKIGSISIYEILDEYARGKFLLKHPNNILCIDKEKIAEVFVEVYKDFVNFRFRLNMVNKSKQNKTREDSKQQCSIQMHIGDRYFPNALDISIKFTKRIFYNLNSSNLSIKELYDRYSRSLLN